MCFSIGWLENILIYLVLIGLVFALVRLYFEPYVLPALGSAGPLILKGLQVILIAFVAIVLIIFVFDLFSCFSGGLGWPSVRR